MHKRRFHSQNAGFEMSAPIGIGVEISAGGDVSLNRRSFGIHDRRTCIYSRAHHFLWFASDVHDRDRRLEGAARVPKSLAISSHSSVHKEMD